MVYTLLIVDDNSFVRNSIKMALESLSDEFKYHLAGTGKETFDILGKEKIDLVLLDIKMPDISGVEVLKKVRADPNLKDIKVALLSSLIEPETVKECEPLVQGFIQKPFDPNTIVDDIKKILNGEFVKKVT